MTRGTTWLVAILLTPGLVADEPADRALVARYRFSAGQGDQLLDDSGHQHHGRIVGAQWETTGDRSALRFDGSGDYIDFGDNRALKMTGDFTLLAWVTLDAPAYPDYTTNWTIFDCEAYPTEGTILRVDGAATTVMFRSSRAGASDVQFGRARLANHGCYLVGVVRQGARARIIVDGVADAELAVGGDPLYGSAAFKISSPSQSFAGLMHEVRIYDRALTANELAAEYWRAAERAGKDIRQRGQLLVRSSAYVDDPHVLVEVDLLGVLPLAPGEKVTVSLTRDDGKLVSAQPVLTVPDSCRQEFVFDMTDQSQGSYALSAEVRDGEGHARATARHVFGYPVQQAVDAPSPQLRTVPPLPALRQRLQPQFTVLPGGGFRAGAAATDRSLAVESSFSVPNGADLQLTATPTAAEHVTVDCSLVTLRNPYYTLVHSMQVPHDGGRILVRDTFTNLTAQPVGVIFAHRLHVDPGTLKRAYLAGRTVLPTLTRALKTNPTAFASLDRFGIGLVALDDVFIVQSQGDCTSQGMGIGSQEFALDANASYTVEWAVYLNETGDYYDLINDLRTDERRNHTTVAGTWASPGQLMSKRTLDFVPPQSYFDVRRPAYFCIPCLSWSTDDPTVSLEGIEFIEYPRERAAVRQVIDAVTAAHPGVKTMFHIAPNLYATNQPDRLWPDSRLIGPDGKQTVYAYNYAAGSYFTKERVADNWRWWSYYPAIGNAYGRALLDSVDVMMHEMGASGVFIDGALWDYGGGYSYDHFDGHTADIDPQTRTITHLKTAVPLLQQHALAAWGRKIIDRGGIVVANNALPTRTFASQPFIFDKEISEGPEMHLLPTPCTLGNPAAIQSETDVYDDILAKLAWGNLYFYYGEPLAMQHELPAARMYPITVTDVRSGCVSGQERIVTARNGVYGWRGERCLHRVYHYDRRGRNIGHDFVTTIDAAGARTAVELDDREMAIVVKLPVTVDSATPVNVIVTRCDQQAIEMSLHGYGAVQITGPDDRTQLLQLTGEQPFAIQPGSAG
jgi:hypothetical protein